MSDNEIIKALESCRGLRLTTVKMFVVEEIGKVEEVENELYIGEILDLINRQKTEIERLQKEKEIFATVDDSLGDLEDAFEEIDRLKIENDSLRMAANSLKMHYNTARAEAIKEFWNRLKVEGKKKVDYYTTEGCDIYFSNGTLCGYVAMKEVGDSIVKEMTGGSE